MVGICLIFDGSSCPLGTGLIDLKLPASDVKFRITFRLIEVAVVGLSCTCSVLCADEFNISPKTIGFGIRECDKVTDGFRT